MDGDDILASMMEARGKARAGAPRPESIGREVAAGLPCGVCDAKIETDDDAVTDLALRIASVMDGSRMPKAVRSMVAEGAGRDGRVVLRLRPYATFCTPPRHVNSSADLPESPTKCLRAFPGSQGEEEAMIPEEHRPFVESHKLAIVGFARKGGPPALSPVYYYVDGDEIVFSTTRTRGKGMAADRLGELTLCIVDMEPPFPYLSISGQARIDEETAVEAMARMAEVITGNALPDAARPMLEQRAQSEGRVAVRVKPYSFSKTDPVLVRPSTS